MWDNSNIQEDIHWGNIELPGITDEELFTTSWNRRASHSEHSARVARWHSEEGAFRTKFLEGMKKLRNDPERWQEYQENYRRGNSEKYLDPEYWDNYYRAIKIRDSDPEYHDRRIAASKKKICRRVHTDQGEFASITEAAQALGLNNSEAVRYRIKSKNFPDYYYLDDDYKPKTKNKK